MTRAMYEATYFAGLRKAGSGRINSNARGTAYRSASATSSKVVKSSALARSTSSREIVIVTLA